MRLLTTFLAFTMLAVSHNNAEPFADHKNAKTYDDIAKVRISKAISQLLTMTGFEEWSVVITKAKWVYSEDEKCYYIGNAWLVYPDSGKFIWVRRRDTRGRMEFWNEGILLFARNGEIEAVFTKTDITVKFAD